MEPMMSDAASEIFEGLQEALLDAQGSTVEGLKKSVVYR
ncbi:MAG: transcriptional regulator, partial [Selenomonas sp.]|nr:transcriptional regulator [Selenomonas sp.]